MDEIFKSANKVELKDRSDKRWQNCNHYFESFGRSSDGYNIFGEKWSRITRKCECGMEQITHMIKAHDGTVTYTEEFKRPEPKKNGLYAQIQH